MNKNKKLTIPCFGVIIILFVMTMMPSIAMKINSTQQINDLNISNNQNADYSLLIISPSNFKNALNPLLTHKINIGIPSKLVTLDEIYGSEYSQEGRDQPEKIKYFIKSAIERWETKYVLLVGGTIGQLPLWYLPVRYVDMGNSFESHFISDLYYADIYDESGINFSSWDSDGDGNYAEWFVWEIPEDTNIDLKPDIALGRLPCRNVFEVNIMVKKIIEYETSGQNKPWFNDMVVIAGDTYPEFENPLWVGYEGEYYGDLALENMSGFNPIRLYTSDDTLTGSSDVINTVNNGCGFLYFVGHGNPMTWGNHPPNNKKFIDGLSVQDMWKLKNNKKYPVCVVSGCHNCQFDVSILKIIDEKSLYRGEATFECWGWRMTRKIGGGSIGTLGATALGHTKEDKTTFEGGINELEVFFFNQYGQNEIEILGETWKAAISTYINTYPVDWSASTEEGMRDSWIDAQVVQSWILIGDPSLMIGGYSQ